MKPWVFKVRGGGNATGIKGGPIKAGIQGGVGALYSQDRVFTIATHPDQWIATPPLTDNQYTYHINPMSTPVVPLRYLSVCSGMEAASVAWHPLGWTPVGFSEIEPFPCAILKHRFPNTPNYGSLTEYQSWPLESGAIDLLVGGTPCQSFSVAGLRKGLTDPRGNLALTFLGLADKLKPRWIVWENVPGVLSSGQPKGSDFGSFLGALVELGYGFAYRVLDAQHFGVPQRRRRVFVVACLGDWRAAAEVLSLREGLRGYLETGNKKRKGVAADAGASATAGGGCWWDGGQVNQTLDAVLSKGQTMPEKNRFPAVLTPVCATGNTTHCLTASSGKGATEDGTDRGTPIVIDRAAFNQGVNAQYVPHIGESEVMDSLVARGPHAVGIPFRKSKRACSTTDNESWVEGEVSNTLNNFDLGDTRTTHAVVQHTMPGSVAPTIGASGPPYSRTGNERVEAEALAVTITPHIVQASELRLRGQITEKSVCPTLTAGAKQGDTEPLAVHAISFQPGNLVRKAGADPSTETFPTLTKDSGDQSPHVAHPTVPLDGMNLLSRLGPCGEEHSLQNFELGDPMFTLKKGGNQHGVLTPMAVRRLTPVECERLQGFPDNWSRISWKGKPETECPDGPRYKACGNSMAVPCMFWIGNRIAEYEANNISQNHETK